jgi:FdhD protein
MLTDLPLADKGIFLSGRASLEMVLKAVRSRIALVAAVSAPSSRAVEAAKQFGITLCGFVRGEEFAVYCHDWRIHDEEASAR